MELGRIPPNDVEAEQAILGCMLTDKDSVIAAMEKLKEEDFTEKIIKLYILQCFHYMEEQSQ